MKQKQVKIIGLSVSKSFGGLKATELAFDEKNRLTVIKGEVGAGKTTLNKAMRLTTQGSSVLTDKNLYGDIDMTAQLSDGDMKIFVGCRTDKNQSLNYFLYGIDKDGNKVKDVILDGQRATPANYLKSLQTALTWRLEELTSENPTTTRNILLELYQNELEAQGVIYNKNHPDYTKGIIHQIELAKNERSLKDMKRKEVGGIADDMTKKGIKFANRRILKDTKALENAVRTIESKISLAETNAEQTKESKLNKLSSRSFEILAKIKDLNAQIIVRNVERKNQQTNIKKVNECLKELITDEVKLFKIKDLIKVSTPDYGQIENEIEFNEKGKITSKPKHFKDNKEIYKLLKEGKEISEEYAVLKKTESKVDNSKLQEELNQAKKALEDAQNYNKDALAVNSFHDWSDAHETVNGLKSDYYLRLTDIDTGVKGLYICTDQHNEEDDNIYLMYDGSYDPEYFNNKKQELRKISAYSGTQKPMICLLIQNYLLSKKNKTLPYLWIDDVPIDNKTRALLEKMAKELDLWLFVNWTGDFKASQLKNGEILIENGEVLMKE